MFPPSPEFEDQLRYRRDVPPQNRRQQPEEAPGVFLPPQGPLEYVPIPPVGDLEGAGSDFHGKGYGYKPGKVGPVYTFVKTDPYAHVKWGVRHVVGKQYAGGHH